MHHLTLMIIIELMQCKHICKNITVRSLIAILHRLEETYTHELLRVT